MASKAVANESHLNESLQRDAIHFVSTFVSSTSGCYVILAFFVETASNESTLLWLQIVVEKDVSTALPFKLSPMR